MYTMDDHHADAIRYPACSLGHVWWQHGNRTGHCARCHATFEGVALFDAHQTSHDGVTTCKDPRTMEYRGVPLRLVDGSWRGPGMPESVKSGHRNARTDEDAD